MRNRNLTKRQALVVEKLGAGVQLKEVAAELKVTTQAVHKSSVAARRKLGLPSHAALIAYGARQGAALAAECASAATNLLQNTPKWMMPSA